MKRSSRYAVLTILFFCACAEEPRRVELSGTCEEAVPLVAGSEVTPGSAVDNDALNAAGAIQVLLSQPATICSATLVGPKTVLTAAHCLVDTSSWNGSSSTVAEFIHPATAIRFLSGSDVSRPTSTHAVSTVLIHPNFHNKASHRNDLALVELEKAVRGVSPIPMYRGSLQSLLGSALTTVAYGNEECNGPDAQIGRRLVGELRLTSLTPTYLRLNDMQRGSITFGDSGAGIFAHGLGQPWLVGVVAARLDSQCDESSATRLSAGGDWLSKQLDTWCIGPEDPNSTLQVNPTTCAEAASCLAECTDTVTWCALACSEGLPEEAFERFAKLAICVRCFKENGSCSYFEENPPPRPITSAVDACDGC